MFSLMKAEGSIELLPNYLSSGLVFAERISSAH
jgi:hypothetical protein